MKLTNIYIKIAAIVAVFTFFSCDDDFNTVGSEIIGDVNFEEKQYTSVPIAYSKKFERVRTSNLQADDGFHANLLGVYNDPIYGQSVYGILSQVIPDQFDPSFGDNAVLDSVVLSLPYYSTQTGTESVEIDENTTETRTLYSLDSVYGNQPFNLAVYQSNYFLRDFDPASNERQIYYSNDIETFGDEVLGDGVPLYTNDTFLPSNKEVVLKTEETDTEGNVQTTRTRITPRVRVKFSDDIRDKFKAQFLDKEGSAELSNPNNFRNYFRGIYFKAEPVNGNGNLVYFNISEANITLHYSFDSTDTSDGDGSGDVERDQGDLVLTFSNNIVNDIRTELDPEIAEELKVENQDVVNGEDNLYLKGGDGSYAAIDLFGGTIINENGEEENELDFLKRQDWLINDASLKFYINQDKVTSGDAEPERIYIFNTETGAVLADYGLDVNLRLVNREDPVNSILNHLGRISRDSDEKGEFYRIRLPQHITSLLNDEDAENLTLGVSVSQNVNITTGILSDTPTTQDDVIPTTSIISHEGTILYGNGENVPESKRLKLDIFYTASKDN